LLLSVGIALASTAWATDRHDPMANRSVVPTVQRLPDSAVWPAQWRRLPALLRSISASIDAPPVVVAVADPITLGLRN
jgi:hypothetical protein